MSKLSEVAKNSENKRIFCIVDPSLKDFIGHHFEYDRSVVDEAAKRGFYGVILGHYAVEKAIAQCVPVKAVFTTDMWGSVPALKNAHPKLDILECNRRFLRDLKRGLSDLPMASDSVLFAHMITAKQIFALAWYAISVSRRCCPEIVLLLRYQPSFYQNRVSAIAFRMLEWVAKSRKIRLSSDSSRLAQEYGKLTSLPIEVLPIPHTVHISERPSARPDPSRPLRLVSLGNARDEKGYLEILQAIQLLNESGRGKDFEFVLQSNDAQPDVQKAIQDFKAHGYSNCTLYEQALNSDEYYDLLNGADGVLVPYWPDVYRARTSGVFLEAAAAGKPVITTNDTWVSDQLKEFGAAVFCHDRNPADLQRSILELKDRFMELSERAHMGRKVCVERHSPAALASALLEPKLVSESTGRIRRLAIFYPWDDLLERRGGASVRCNLMIDFLKCHVDEIRVLQAGCAPATKIGNVTFESYRGNGRIVQIADRSFEFLVTMLTPFRRSVRRELQILWFHLSARIDGEFSRRVRELVRWSDATLLEYTFWGNPVLNICREEKRKVVLTDYDVVSDQIRRPHWLRKKVLSMECKALQQADYGVTVSQADQEFFRTKGIETKMLANPVDVASAKFPFPKEYLHETLELLYNLNLRGKRVCLFVGSGFAPNIEAVRRMEEMLGRGRKINGFEDILFVIAGGCAAPSSAPGMIKLGKIDDFLLHALYQIADLVLIPLPDGTGASLKTVEAMAFGVPIVGTTVAFRGLKVTSGKESVVLDDMTEYPRTILDLLNDPDRRKKIAKHGYELAESYDFRRVFRPYLALLGIVSSSESIDENQIGGESFREYYKSAIKQAIWRQKAEIGLALVRDFLDRWPQETEAQFLYAELLAASGADIGAVLDTCSRVKLKSNDIGAFAIRMTQYRLYSKLNRTLEAEASLSEAIQLRKSNVCTSVQLNNFLVELWQLFELGDYWAVLALIEPLIIQHPLNGSLSYLTALCLRKSNSDRHAALTYYYKALELGYKEKANTPLFDGSDFEKNSVEQSHYSPNELVEKSSELKIIIKKDELRLAQAMVSAIKTTGLWNVVKKLGYIVLKNGVFITHPRFFLELTKLRKIGGHFDRTICLPEFNQYSLEKKIKAYWRITNEFRFSRMKSYSELVRLESKLGHDIIATAYRIRKFRLLGCAASNELESVLSQLEPAGLTNEADVVRRMYGRDHYDSASLQLEYLQNRKALLIENNLKIRHEILENGRSIIEPVISILVSFSDDEGVLSLFLQDIKKQTLFLKDKIEVILVNTSIPSVDRDRHRKLFNEAGIPGLYIGTDQLESTSTGWNLGIYASRSKYLSCLGLRQSLKTNALETMLDTIQQDENLDWIIARSFFQNDVTASNINCNSRKVNGIYRKEIHENFGYYDASFKMAGETEFMNRVLPFIKIGEIDGEFLGKSEDQIQSSALLELEEIRACSIFKTLGGVKYAFQNVTGTVELEEQFWRTISHRQAHRNGVTSDIEYGRNLLLHILERDSYHRLRPLLAEIDTLLTICRGFDQMATFSSQATVLRGVKSLRAIKGIEARFNSLSPKRGVLFDILNDFRYEQHSENLSF